MDNKAGRAKGARGPNKFNRREIARGCRALEDAGLQVARVEIDHSGKIAIVTVTPNDKAATPNDKAATAADPPNPWEALKP